MADFAGFELVGRVAEGSTGVVWLARQVELDRLVAIKELSPALRLRPGFLERFRAEAQTLALLDDPHVVRVFDYVEEPGRAYLVQEWVDGAPLSVVLAERGTLTAEQALGVLRGGLTGLAQAHERGLVHRDISPANILLDRDGTSKLVDFGLAAPTDQGITVGADTSVGTPAFSSPEAATGAPMTTRSDVYSAAAVLYLLLSGRLPYPGDVAQVLQAHISAPVPTLDGHGPHLADLITRAMAKNPAERPADAAAFLAELEQAATQRYGAGWLSRSSVAGLVTATAGTAATATAAGSSSAAAPAAAVAAAALAYGATTTPATAATTPARTGARILGLPLAGAAIIAALIIAAVATTVVVTSTSGPQTVADKPAGTQDGTTPTTTATPPVPAFSGTYEYVTTITEITGNFSNQIGETFMDTWRVTASCQSGPCDAGVVSSDGTFTLFFTDGVWRRDFPLTADCLDESGLPDGTSIPIDVTQQLSPLAPLESDPSTPVQGLVGEEVYTYPFLCSGEPGRVVQTVALTRSGD